jgi:hypothetical protein
LKEKKILSAEDIQTVLKTAILGLRLKTLKACSEDILEYNTDNCLVIAAAETCNHQALEYLFHQDPKLAQSSQLLHRVLDLYRKFSPKAREKAVIVLLKAGALIDEQNIKVITQQLL